LCTRHIFLCDKPQSSAAKLTLSRGSATIEVCEADLRLQGVAMRRPKIFERVDRRLAAAGLVLFAGLCGAVDDLAAAPAQSGSSPGSASRKPVVKEYAPNVPAVMLTAGHAALCRLGVGDAFPTFELPALDGGAADRNSLAGAKATVILIWTVDRWMSETALRDLATIQRDGVALVGIASGVDATAAQQAVADSGAKFVQLHDADGALLAQVGEGSLPRVFVLDNQRRIAWFDIEYSEATRRELQQTLAALTGGER
jgi:hypothetical protein